MNDTLAWLLNFPVTNGFAICFTAGFGLFGAVMAIFQGSLTGTNSQKLAAIRTREGLPEPSPWDGARPVLTRARRISAIVLTVVLAVALAAGIRGLTSTSTTRQYIWDHGVTATATVTDGFYENLTFVAKDGQRYTVRNDFFSSAMYPQGEYEMLSEGDRVEVRYLPGHPQAFVIDLSSIEEDE